jgi:hypothetical protein
MYVSYCNTTYEKDWREVFYGIASYEKDCPQTSYSVTTYEMDFTALVSVRKLLIKIT